jgi:hypothetical protein
MQFKLLKIVCARWSGLSGWRPLARASLLDLPPQRCVGRQVVLLKNGPEKQKARMLW